MQETLQSTNGKTSRPVPQAEDVQRLVPRIKKFPVMEVFGPTIQGEGALAGRQTAFIRFGLCDYKCVKCDSIHAIDPHFVSANAMWMTDLEIYDEVRKHIHTNQWVTLSGGNPAIHDLTTLVELLQEQDIPLAIETQGTKAPEWIASLEVVTVSPKSPGMGERFEPDKFGEFLEKFRGHPGLNVKVVIFTNQDLEFAAMINSDFILPHHLDDSFFLSLGNPDVPILVEGELHTGTDQKDGQRLTLLQSYAILAEEICQDPRLSNAAFMPQLHVLAYGNEPGR
jgi:7-carboxy-7-deazaguanine synthase